MAACLWQETRLNLDPAYPSSTIDVLIPSHASSAFASRSSPKRRRLNSSNLNYDEDTFSRLHLASEASIHFRPTSADTKKSTPPRAILWRVLDGRTVLELQAVDLWQDDESPEPLLTLRLTLPSTILPRGVVFTEREGGSSPSIATAFVVTTSGELLTLELRKEVFTKPDVALAGAKSWIDRSRSSALSSRNPFKIVATSARQLWASLADGQIVRLDRENASWRETFYTEGKWKASWGSLIAWRPGSITAREGDVNLAPGTAISMMLSPDEKHTWVVCSDHTLKAWDVETGRIAFSVDLAGDTSRDLERPVDHLLDPQQAQLLRIVPSRQLGEYTVIAFSPYSRQFKFWSIRNVDVPEHGVQDLRPDVKLTPPVEDLTSTNVWNLEDFHIQPPQASGEPWSIWILTRSGAKCSTFHLEFSLDDHADLLQQAWKHNWSRVCNGMNTVEELAEKALLPSGSETEDVHKTSLDVADQWCEYLFYPGRFSTPTLETALTVFWKSLGRNKQSSHAVSPRSTRSLKERLCEAVGCSVELTHLTDGTPAYEKYSNDILAQWRTFYGVARDLHKRRSETIGLSFDAHLDAPWLVMADQIVPIRYASQCEILWLNRDTFSQPEEVPSYTVLRQSLADSRAAELGQLFAAVDLFRSSLPPTFVTSFASILESECLQNTSMSSEQVDLEYDLQSIFDKSGFANLVGDDDYQALIDALEPLGGLGNLDNEIFLGVLDFLDEAREGLPQRKQVTRYGARAIIRGAQETLELGSNIILELLLLVVFMGGELEENGLHESFDAPSILAALMSKAKEYYLLTWLASTPRQETLEADTDEPSPSAGQLVKADDAERSEPKSFISSSLESMFIGDWSTIETPTTIRKQPLLLSYWCRAWTFGMRLSKQYDAVATHVMATLVKSCDYALASQFTKFLPESPWCYYLIGRLHLGEGDFVQAALFFKAASDGLAIGRYFDVEQHDSATILDLDEREHFNDGLARYYQHIVALFEKLKVMPYVSEFAELALDALEEEDDKEDPALENELLSRQFNATLQTSRYKAACAALTGITDSALRKSCTQQLLKAILTSPNPQTHRLILDLNFPSPSDVDTHLHDLASKTTPMSISASLTSVDKRPRSSNSLLDMPGSSSNKQQNSSPQFHKLLYAYRIHNNDLRGAATCLWERLQLLVSARDHPLQRSKAANKQNGALVKAGTFAVPESDEEDDNDETANALDEEISSTYLILINVLTLMPTANAWILSRPLPAPPKPIVPGKVGANRAQKDDDDNAHKAGEVKRTVITLDIVRKKWQEELDRSADLRAGRFAAFDVWDGRLESDGDAAGLGQNGAMEVDVFG